MNNPSISEAFIQLLQATITRNDKAAEFWNDHIVYPKTLRANCFLCACIFRAQIRTNMVSYIKKKQKITFEQSGKNKMKIDPRRYEVFGTLTTNSSGPNTLRIMKNKQIND